MKNNFDNWEDIFEFPTLEDYTDSIVFKNFLLKNQGGKKESIINEAKTIVQLVQKNTFIK